MSDTARRAALLVQLFPRQWRRRYPDFAQVLADELADHPRGVRRDVARAAAVEHLRVAGVLPASPSTTASSGLGLLFGSLVPFVALSAGMWSQLRTSTAGRGDALPALRSTQQLLAAGTTLAVAALLIAVIMVAVRALRRHTAYGVRARRSSLAAPLATLALSIGTLTGVGWMADRSGWYSPAAAALPSGGLGGALTLWARGIVAAITPAWAHPGLFGQMPAGEIAAAVAAPVAAVAASAAVLRLSIRLPAWSPRRRHAVIAVATVGAMFLSAAATARWLLSAPHLAGIISSTAGASRLSPGHTPWAVVVALVALTAFAAVGARRVLQGRPPTSPLPGKPRSLPAGDRPPRGGWSVGTRRFAPVAADQ